MSSSATGLASSLGRPRAPANNPEQGERSFKVFDRTVELSVMTDAIGAQLFTQNDETRSARRGQAASRHRHAPGLSYAPDPVFTMTYSSSD